MRTIRASWIILFLVILIVLAVKPLRDQARLEWAARPWPHVPFQASPRADPRETFTSDRVGAVSPMQLGDSWHWKVLTHYRARVLPFVEQNYPNDSDMLLAAALLADLEGDDAQRLSSSNAPSRPTARRPLTPPIASHFGMPAPIGRAWDPWVATPAILKASPGPKRYWRR